VTELKLPEQFKGAWENALIVTYGADIPFFENGLWRQFGSRCRNKIILADGQRFLESCQSFAQGDLIRHLNHQYVAEGIFTHNAAHAKLVLLTNPEGGRLLVGSGNLGWQGYASGGELFTHYEYTIKDPDAGERLNPFLAAWEFVQELVTRGYVTGHSARQRLDHLYEHTPWLYQKPVGNWQPVRHNLDVSFFEQIKTLIGEQPVRELRVLSPFYDREVIALARLLETFTPERAILLVQPRHTSVDPNALQKMLDRFPNCQVQVCTSKNEGTYLHAKLYLFKLANRTICLQGSPNLSQVAMLRPAAKGNIELANLLIGTPNAFDHLFDDLQIETAPVRLETLDLSFASTDQAASSVSGIWQLTGGEWLDDNLHLTYRGALPDLQSAVVIIGDHLFSFNIRHHEIGNLEIKVTNQMAERLHRPVPVAIHWEDGAGSYTSNPVFVCNRVNLNAVLEVSEEDDGDTLHRLGDLDLDDDELERLLGELDAALMVDRRSVWQIAGRPVPSMVNDNGDSDFALSYDDIDYEMLRQHPKIAQYRNRGIAERYVKSRLQIILNSITDHFQGLLAVPEQHEIVKQIIDNDSGAETEEEREQETEDTERRRRSAAQRLERILKNFIGRYLRGLQSPDFQELAGYEVIGQNYIIFSHLLWRLLTKGWVSDAFIIEAFLDTWAFFWGNDIQTGYFYALTKDQQSEILHWLRKHHTDAELVATLAYFTDLTEPGRRDDNDLENKQELQFLLRDFWRRLLRLVPFEMDAKIVEESWRIFAGVFFYNIPLPTQIIQKLVQLAYFETGFKFCRRIEKAYGLRPFSCDFDNKMQVFGRDKFKCLVIKEKNVLDNQSKSLDILKDWIKFETLDYYRMSAPNSSNTHAGLFYEPDQKLGNYWAGTSFDDKDTEFGPIEPEKSDWEYILEYIEVIAQELDSNLRFESVVI